MHPSLPRGAGNGFAFAVCNTFPVTLLLGAPMVLYFKHLGATATVLGILAALPPLLSLLQLPAAHFIERVGYRTFMLRGWSARTVFLFLMAAVPLLPSSVPAGSRAVLMLFLLFIFHTLRGISMCGWLPWLSQWIPEEVRGRYLGREQVLNSFAMLTTSAIAAWWMGPGSGSFAYAGLFLLGSLGALASLVFLRRIPDVPVPPESRSAAAPPWRAILRHPPFFRLLLFNLVVLAAYAGSGVFWIPLLRDHHHVSDRYALNLVVLTSLIAAPCLLLFGRMADRVGSRPLLALSGASQGVHYLLWCALGARVLPLNNGVAFLLQATSALSVSLYGLANMRLLMGLVPAQGRSHFLALFTSLSALASGIMPIVWGVMLDAIGAWTRSIGPWEWNRYSLLYGLLFLLVLVAQWLRTRLPEPRAMKTERFLHELFVRTPARLLGRVFHPRPESPEL
ncbi:MAG TPA: MFS transporter [Kiritimatiellia bacterium]|nr:MFS transporter [Kiritimatiellia bacterium]